MKYNMNDVLVSKSGTAVKVLAVVKQSKIARENLVVVADATLGADGKYYKNQKTNRIIKQSTLERHYN